MQSHTNQVPYLNDEISSSEDTDLFIKFFTTIRPNDTQTFSGGRSHWTKTIKLEQDAVNTRIREVTLYENFDEALKPTVLAAMDALGLDRIRNPSQLEEIFTVLEHAKKMKTGSKVTPSITISPCGSGKTENLKVIAKCL